MRISYIILLLLMTIVSKGEHRFEISEANLTRLHSSSAVVFILHWNDEAEDYLVENIKSLPSEQNIESKFESWKKLVDKWSPQDPFGSNIRPQHILMFFNTAPEEDFYRKQIFVIKESVKMQGVTLKQVLSILRKLKSEKMPK